jgi:hypothetical protein
MHVFAAFRKAPRRSVHDVPHRRRPAARVAHVGMRKRRWKSRALVLLHSSRGVLRPISDCTQLKSGPGAASAWLLLPVIRAHTKHKGDQRRSMGGRSTSWGGARTAQGLSMTNAVARSHGTLHGAGHAMAAWVGVTKGHACV